MLELHINNSSHYADFIALNEQWISHYFSLEAADHALAANPGAVIDKGGYILSLTQEGKVLGVCALFKQTDGNYELARLAVDKNFRHQGHGDRLIKAALSILISNGVPKVSLMSNTRLTPALALYRKHGFQAVLEGPHPVYTRTNIVMEKDLLTNDHV